MKIKNFKCNNFGGVISQDISFSDGLNVIVGPNEAGKSTIVEGLHATLFRKPRLKKSSNADNEFLKRFRPYPNGDSMSGSISFDISGMKYEISKGWGASKSVALTLDGQVIKDEDTVNEKLKELLKYGENTYNNIVFAKQKDIKEAIERINKDEETSSVVGDLLRKAIMALDGVSLEKLKKKIDEEFDLLQRRWDITNNRPEGNKGIDNRWKIGVGEVLEKFYEKEELLRNMKYAQKLEDEYSAIVQEVKDVEGKKNSVRDEINKYKRIEGDILQRAILEPKLETLRKDIAALREINKEYPVKEVALKTKAEELTKLDKDIEELKQELTLAQKVKEASAAKDLLLKVERIESVIGEKTNEKNKLAAIQDADIKRIEELQRKMDNAKSAMEAGTLLGKLNKSDRQIFITRGLEDKEEISTGTDFSASGYLKIEVDSCVELEIKAGEIDFEELKNIFNQAKAELDGYFKKFNVSEIAEAKLKHRLFKQLTDEIEKYQSQIKLLLGDKNLEDLKRQVSETQDIKARTVEEINQAKEKANKQIIQISAEIASLKSTLEGWMKKYGDLDKVIDTLALSLKEISEVEKIIENLAKLPDGFETAKDFQEHLAKLRSNLEKTVDFENALKEKYHEVSGRLPEFSYEELRPIYKEAEEKFQKRLARLNRLFKIKQVFERKLSEMDKGSFEPLAKTFSKYLSIITLGSYHGGEINDSLLVNVVKNNNKKLPLDLLSAGTYDCVLLAIRLSLLDYLFGGKDGLVVLDDCLVNLDPKRKEKAVELIKEFAKNNQVIFTTCDPGTAALLGGNIITLQAS